MMTAGVNVVTAPIKYSQAFGPLKRMIAWSMFAVWATWKSLTTPGVDLIYATSTPLSVAIPAIAAKRIRRTPFVFEVRDLWPEVPIALGELNGTIAKSVATRLAVAAYQHAQHVVALSPGMKNRIVVDYSIGDGNVCVIPNGSEPAWLTHGDALPTWWWTHRLSASDVVLYGGSFGRVNQVEYLVHVAHALRQTSSIRFLLVGDGSEWESVRDLARRLDLLGDSVFVEKSVPKSAYISLVKRAAISVSTTQPIVELWENSANKIFDAFAVATPVAINHGGWLADLLEKTGAGLVLDPVSPAAAAANLRSFLADAQKRDSAARASQRLGGAIFNWDAAAERLDAVIRGDTPIPSFDYLA